MLSAMDHRLESRRLYIADLVRRQYEMESGRVAMQPLAYRVLSRRLRDALAGLPEPAARRGFSELPAPLLPGVAEMLETRHFDHHRRLHGPGAPNCRAVADAAIAKAKRG